MGASKKCSILLCAGLAEQQSWGLAVSCATNPGRRPHLFAFVWLFRQRIIDSAWFCITKHTNTLIDTLTHTLIEPTWLCKSIDKLYDFDIVVYSCQRGTIKTLMAVKALFPHTHPHALEPNQTQSHTHTNTRRVVNLVDFLTDCGASKCHILWRQSQVARISVLSIKREGPGEFLVSVWMRWPTAQMTGIQYKYFHLSLTLIGFQETNDMFDKLLD